MYTADVSLICASLQKIFRVWTDDAGQDNFAHICKDEAGYRDAKFDIYLIVMFKTKWTVQY